MTTAIDQTICDDCGAKLTAAEVGVIDVCDACCPRDGVLATPPPPRGTDVLGVSEVAERLGVTRHLVSQWLVRGQLPEPDARLAMGPVWWAATIEEWQRQRV